MDGIEGRKERTKERWMEVKEEEKKDRWMDGRKVGRNE